MNFFINFLFVIIYSISVSGLGVVFFSRVLKTKINFPAGFFAGSGLIIAVLFIAGITGIFDKLFFLILTIIVFCFSVVGIRHLLMESFSFDKKYLIPLTLLAVVLLTVGLTSLSPPVKNDTLFYHLGLPKLWAYDECIKFYPSHSLSVTALSSELLLTPIISLVSPQAGQFFVFITGLMIIFLLGQVYHRFTGGSKMLALLSLGAVPFFISGLADAKNDYLATGFALMAIFFYLEYLESKQTKLIIIAGLFAGLAASAKANALIFAAAMLLGLIFSKHRPKDIALFCGGAVIFGLPWYLRAYIETGNPVYPFYNSIFSSLYWHDIFDVFNQTTNVESEHRSILNFITSPFRLVYDPDIFRGRIGPLPLILLPFLAFKRPLPGYLKKILAVSVLFYIFWYLAWPNARYLMPVVPLLVLMSAYIIEWLIKSVKLAKFIIISAFCLLYAFTGVQIGRDGVNRIKAAAGLIEKDQFLKSERILDPNKLMSAVREPAFPYYDVWNFLNKTSKPEARVGILCSNWYRADGFYLDRRFVYLNPTEQVVVDFTGSKEDIEESLRRISFDYIVIDNEVVGEFSDSSVNNSIYSFDIFNRGVKNFAEIVKQNGRLIFQTDRFELYRAGK